MKHVISLLAGVAILSAACSDSSVTEPPDLAPSFGLAKGKARVSVCHKGRTITVAAPALTAHLAHGDTEGECGPACVAPPTGLVSWWPGDGNANDLIGGNNGTLRNGATFATGFVTSGNGQAFSFDGVDDFVTGSTTGFPSGTSARTVDLWAKVTGISTQAAGALFIYGDAQLGKNFGLWEDHGGGSPNSFISFVSRSDDFRPFVGEVLNDGEWHHIAMTYDGTDIAAYVDAELTWTHTKSLDTHLGAFRIGRSLWNSNSFNGLIDEVELFNRALSPEEIQRIFDAGSAGKCKP